MPFDQPGPGFSIFSSYFECAATDVVKKTDAPRACRQLEDDTRKGWDLAVGRVHVVGGCDGLPPHRTGSS